MVRLETHRHIRAALGVLMAAGVEVAALKKPPWVLASTRTKTEALVALEQCGSFGGLDAPSHQQARGMCND